MDLYTPMRGFFISPFKQKETVEHLRVKLLEFEGGEKAPFFIETCARKEENETLFVIGTIEKMHPGEVVSLRNTEDLSERNEPLPPRHKRVDKGLWAIIIGKEVSVLLCENRKGQVPGSSRLFDFLRKEDISLKRRQIAFNFKEYRDRIEEIKEVVVNLGAVGIPLDNLGIKDGFRTQLKQMDNIAHELKAEITVKINKTVAVSKALSLLEKMIESSREDAAVTAVKAQLKWQKGFADMSDRISDADTRLNLKLGFSQIEDDRTREKIADGFLPLVAQWYNNQLLILARTYRKMRESS